MCFSVRWLWSVVLQCDVILVSIAMFQCEVIQVCCVFQCEIIQVYYSMFLCEVIQVCVFQCEMSQVSVVLFVIHVMSLGAVNTAVFAVSVWIAISTRFTSPCPPRSTRPWPWCRWRRSRMWRTATSVAARSRLKSCVRWWRPPFFMWVLRHFLASVIYEGRYRKPGIVTVWPGASVKHSVSVCTEAHGDQHACTRQVQACVHSHARNQEFKNVYALVCTCVWHT